MTSGIAALTAPGGAYEIVEEQVLGERMRMFKHRPRSARQLLLESARFGATEYLVHDDRRFSFDAHLVAVADVAAVLRDDYGVGKGDRVALLAANSAEWVIGLWATLSLGGIAASMNAWWAPPEIAHAMQSSEPKVVLADEPRRAALAALGINTPVLVLDDRRRSDCDNTSR